MVQGMLGCVLECGHMNVVEWKRYWLSQNFNEIAKVEIVKKWTCSLSLGIVKWVFKNVKGI